MGLSPNPDIKDGFCFVYQSICFVYAVEKDNDVFWILAALKEQLILEYSFHFDG